MHGGEGRCCFETWQQKRSTAKLFLICSEYVNELEGGQSINLNTWILSGLNTLTLQFVIEHLNNERIDFTKFNDKISEDYIRIHLTDSQIQLTFIGEDDNSNRIVNPFHSESPRPESPRARLF